MVDKSRVVRIVLLLAFVLAAAAPSALAQTTTATVQGVVRDANKGVLPGVTVTMRDTQTGYTRTTTTDKAGVYVLGYIPASSYELTAELPGFAPLKRSGLQFTVGQESTLDLMLQLASVEESVTVTAEAPLVEVSKSTLDKVVKREQIDELPLSGRNAASLAQLAPGVVPRGSTEEPVTAMGQPRGSGEVLVDGVSNLGMSTNNVRSSAPPDAIQEFQVQTSSFAAEFGHATGIVLNTITRSGTNDPHGRVYYFHRDSALDSKNSFATSKTTFNQKQLGGWFGGPIVKDRTHFFITFEATRGKNVASVTSPLEPGDVDQPFKNNQVLGKITHQLNDRNTLNVRGSLDRPTQENQGVGGIYLKSYGFNTLSRDLAFVGNLASILSKNALNEVRFQVSGRMTDFTTADPKAYTIQRPTSWSGKAPNLPQAFPENRFQFIDNFSYDFGAHRLKFGADISRVSMKGFLYQYNPGYFIFTTDKPFDANDPTTFPALAYINNSDPNFGYTATGYAFFAQDAWHPGHNLTLNIGLRYDGWSMEGLDLQKKNFAPRLGFAWDPSGKGKTVIRGGTGIYFGSTMFNTALLANWLGTQTIQIIQSPGYPDPLSKGKPAGSVVSSYLSEPNQPLPRAYNSTIGIQRELWKGFSVSADYVSAKGRELVRMIQTNPLLGPPAYARQDPTKGSLQMLHASGYSNYNGLLVGLQQRTTRATFGLAYTLSAYKTTNDAESTGYYQSDLTPDDAYGYGLQDQRHRVVLHATVNLPGRFLIGAIFQSATGTPFNITTGKDNDKNGSLTDRPNLAAGAQIGTNDMLNNASFVDPGLFAGNLPRNAGRGPAFWQLDARVSKRFAMRKTQAEVLIEAFNLTNRTNLNNPIGNLTSASFGKSISTSGPARQVQLGFRFEF